MATNIETSSQMKQPSLSIEPLAQRNDVSAGENITDAEDFNVLFPVLNNMMSPTALSDPPFGSLLDPEHQNSKFPTGNVLNENQIKFQLIPICTIPGKAAIGDVSECLIDLNQKIRIGRKATQENSPAKKENDFNIYYTSKVVSRNHCEVFLKDGSLYLRDVGSSSGTFLNKLRLSPLGKESRPYIVKQGDIIQLGMDFKGKSEDEFRAVLLKIGFYDQAWIESQRKNANPRKFTKALAEFISVVANPYGQNPTVPLEEEPAEIECCICINAIAPYQALFISPCSHIYHHKCVAQMIAKTPMFLCPLCRQVANLTASVSTGELGSTDMSISNILVEKEQPTKPEPTHPPTFNELSAALQSIIGNSNDEPASTKPSKFGNFLRRMSTAPESVHAIQGSSAAPVPITTGEPITENAIKRGGFFRKVGGRTRSTSEAPNPKSDKPEITAKQ